ncbi:MAG: M20/M25/M40 family metallo-hydrolase, partial [Thermodesulfobacteriota bacterium]
MNERRTPVDPKRLRHLLRRLLSIYSPSGKEEELIDYLAGYLKRRGLPAARQEVAEGRANLIAAPGAAEPAMAFIGHVDTVHAFDLEDYGPRGDDDTITALGAADMKGGCAAMVEAFLCLWTTSGGPGFPLALALLVGEEEDGDGAVRLVRDHHFPWAVLGEATDLRPCLSHYGYL